MKREPDSLQPSESDRIRDHFVGWQCRVRQICMRQDGGRPSSGMRPRLLLTDGRELSPGMIVLITPKEPEESTEFFRFQLRKTHDPNQIYERGLQYLSATHFQNSAKFSDRLTASFGAGSAMAAAVLEAGECILEFSQFSQSYRLSCRVTDLAPEDPAYQATLWHNKIFNPQMPGDPQILAFQPDWRSAQADPMP